LRCSGAAALSWARWDTNTLGTGRTTLVGRFYVNIATISNAEFEIFRVNNTNEQWSLRYDDSTDNFKLYAGATGTTLKVTGPSYDQNLGLWVRIDFKITNISTTVATWEWSVDGVAATTATGSTVSAGGAVVNVTLGDTVASGVTKNLDYDDVALSVTAADYPIGPGYGGVVLPTSLTLHSTGVFVQDATATVITTGDWARLDEIPISETSTFIRQTTGSNNVTTGVPIVGFTNTVNDSINGVRLVTAYGAAATGAAKELG
jgi:hypothetical protein